MKPQIIIPKSLCLAFLIASIFWLAVSVSTEATYKDDNRHFYQNIISSENASFVNTPSCDHSIPLNVMIIDGNVAPYNNINSGDVVCLEAGIRQGTMRIQNFEGSPGNPIIFTNHNGKVVIENEIVLLKLENVQYIHLTGSGDESLDYGIELRNAEIALRTYAFTQHLEIDHLEIHQISSIGMLMPSAAQYDNNVQGLYIHHNNLHDIGREGLYIGRHTYNDDPNTTILKDIEIAYNTLERLGWDGIQVGAAVENVKVHHNHINDAGLSLATDSGNNGTGIMLNPGTTGDFYNNIIINTRRAGIYDQGLGKSRFFNNLIVNAGTIGNQGHNQGGEGIKVWTNSGAIYNNTIINTNNDGIGIRGSAANGIIYNNIVVGSAGDHIVAKGYTKHNNIESGNATGLGFVDPVQNNYQLTSKSPAVNTGDMQYEVPAFDLNDMPRDTLADLGAYEYPATSPLPPIEPSSDQVTLTFDGLNNINLGETVDINVIAQNVPSPGLYGIQFDVNFDPSLVSVSNLQINPNLSFVLLNSIDNTNGRIRFVASQQGKVPGLIGNITLLSFKLTGNNSGSSNLAFENQEMSNSQAQGFDFISQNYPFLIEGDTTPSEPTPEPTDEPIPGPTDEPAPEPTDEPIPGPTDEPTPEPTDEPIPGPTDEPAPEPQKSTLFGQVILAGRSNNNWSDATVTIGDNALFTTTDSTGNFSIGDITMGSNHIIIADADGYISSICSGLTVNEIEVALTAVTLLSGDINGDSLVDITDATAIGVAFGQTGSNLPADINRDNKLNIFDIVLVTVNFGVEGPQNWDCMNK